jgi:hypothetical protein
MGNIFLELELFLDPPITEAGAMEEHLEKVKILDWMKRQNDDMKYKVFVAKARSYIAERLPQLEQQGKAAREEKYEELKKQAETIIGIGVTERFIKNLVNDFKKFFREDTIKKLVPLEISSSNQSDDEFVKLDCPPNSLKCDKPVPYADMVKISCDLRDVEKKDLYDLLRVKRGTDCEKILEKVQELKEKVRCTPATDYKKDILNHLHQRCGLYFKTPEGKTCYDVALRRFNFEKYAEETLKLYVASWSAKKKTDWKEYHDRIAEVKELTYKPEEAAWLVYEYVCKKKRGLTSLRVIFS